MSHRRRTVPRATYRVQLHAGFTLHDATEIVPYLAGLGVSHLYCSPVLQAAPGSTHGYDVVDHRRVSTELGGEPAFDRLTDALRAHGMGLVLDIVPNHMAIAEENRWWWDVLEHGRASRYSDWFDVDWDPPEARLRNVILLPVLPDHYGRVLEAGEIRVERRGRSVVVRHGDRAFPVDPQTLDGLAGDRLERAVAELNADVNALDAFLEQQNYRLAYWRASLRDLGYRRFFDIDELIGLRMEDERVFAATHELVLRWVAEGRVQGLRIDHPDGLRDPAGYFARLRAAAPDTWIVAEKILEGDERLPASWPIDGTTGYGLANLATGVLVQRAAERTFTDLWAEVADAGPGWEAIAAGARAEVLATVLGSDVNRLTDLFVAVCEANRRYRDFTRHELHHALREVAAALPVYRTYVRPGDRHVSETDARLIARAVETAAARRPDLDADLFAFLGRILRLEDGGPLADELATRFQQLTPAAMAKGVEDTAFYRHHRLVALNEVGGDPGRFGVDPAGFHDAMQVAQRDWPSAMLALSTHDTKRSADVRARLAAMTHRAEEWTAVVDRLTAASTAHRAAPDRPTPADAYLFFQVVVGAWPLDSDRAAEYMRKASREAKLRSSWTDPEPEYDEALEAFVRGALADDAFVGEVERTVAVLADEAWRAALAQLALQGNAPGVPDVYQGAELWDLSLVDPDNRRPVDYSERRRLLDEARSCSAADAWARRASGLPKLWLLHRTLDLRRRRPEAFDERATYRPVATEGAGGAVLAFSRGPVVTAVPLLPGGPAADGAAVCLPDGTWRGLDGVERSGRVPVGELFAAFPVAVLERVR